MLFFAAADPLGYQALPSQPEPAAAPGQQEGAALQPKTILKCFWEAADWEPAVVDGLDGVFGAVTSEMETVAQLGYRAMAASGWSGADPASITALDRSGHGGSKTYKLCCPTHAPHAVALHLG